MLGKFFTFVTPAQTSVFRWCSLHVPPLCCSGGRSSRLKAPPKAPSEQDFKAIDEQKSCPALFTAHPALRANTQIVQNPP